MAPLAMAALGLLGVTGILVVTRKPAPQTPPPGTVTAPGTVPGTTVQPSVPAAPGAVQIIPLPGLLADVNDDVLVDLNLLPSGTASTILTSPEARLASLGGATIMQVRVTGIDASTSNLIGNATGIKIPVAEAVTQFMTPIPVPPFPRTAVIQVTKGGTVVAKSPTAV